MIKNFTIAFLLLPFLGLSQDDSLKIEEIDAWVRKIDLMTGDLELCGNPLSIHDLKETNPLFYAKLKGKKTLHRVAERVNDTTMVIFYYQKDNLIKVVEYTYIGNKEISNSNYYWKGISIGKDKDAGKKLLEKSKIHMQDFKAGKARYIRLT